MPAVQEDFHDLTYLVASAWTLQLLLSAAGVGSKR
jgi:hypothetical protein